LNKPLQVSEDDVPYGTSQVDSGLGQVLQIHNLYLVTQSENGLMIVDQHAAHERVLYEKFVQEFSSKKNIKNRQELLVPLDLELMANEILFLEENWKVFEKLGFDVHIKNTNQISKMNALKRVSLAAVPIWATNKNLIQLIKEVIRDIEEDTLVGKIDDQSLRVLTYMACRSAVKAGDRLSEQEMRHILESLDLTQNNYTCPHGRPVKVEIGLRELERMFMRAGFREAVE
jgi:DNA mismatch repair protein MutL